MAAWGFRGARCGQGERACGCLTRKMPSLICCFMKEWGDLATPRAPEGMPASPARGRQGSVRSPSPRPARGVPWEALPRSSVLKSELAENNFLIFHVLPNQSVRHRPSRQRVVVRALTSRGTWLREGAQSFSLSLICQARPGAAFWSYQQRTDGCWSHGAEGAGGAPGSVAAL